MKILNLHVEEFRSLKSLDWTPGDLSNNLELRRTDQQRLFLNADAEMREQYILSYMLEVESRGSQSLLNVEAFRDPDEYKQKDV